MRDQSIALGWQYALDILDNKIPSTSYLKGQCRYIVEQYKQSLEDESTKYHFDDKAAQHAVDYFSKVLVLTEGFLEPTPFFLEPWQIFFVMSIFGWRIRGKRGLRFKHIILFCGRKNGKTCLLAGMALYAMEIFPLQSQFYGVATKEAQAGIILRFALSFREYMAPLDRKRWTGGRGWLGLKARNTTFKTLGRNSKTQDGLNAAGVFFDEACAIPDPNQFAVMHSSQAANPYALNFYLTTAQADENYFYIEILAPLMINLKKIGNRAPDENYLDDTDLNERHFGLCYTIEDHEKDELWNKEEGWIKANPNYNVTVLPEFMEDEVRRVTGSKTAKFDFMVKNLNIFSPSEKSWLSIQDLNVGATDGDPPVDPKAIAIASVDLGGKQDLCAIMLWYKNPDGTRSMFPKFFYSQDSYNQLPHVTKARFGKGIEEGSLELVPGRVVDSTIVISYLNTLIKEKKVRQIGYDNYNSVSAMGELLNRYPRTLPNGQNLFEPIPQSGYQNDGSAKMLEELVSQHKLRFKRSEFLTWQFGNAIIEPDIRGNLHVHRPKLNPNAKIDAVATAIMCCKIDAYMLPTSTRVSSF